MFSSGVYVTFNWDIHAANCKGRQSLSLLRMSDDQRAYLGRASRGRGGVAVVGANLLPGTLPS